MYDDETMQDLVNTQQRLVQQVKHLKEELAIMKGNFTEVKRFQNQFMENFTRYDRELGLCKARVNDTHRASLQNSASKKSSPFFSSFLRSFKTYGIAPQQR